MPDFNSDLVPVSSAPKAAAPPPVNFDADLEPAGPRATLQSALAKPGKQTPLEVSPDYTDAEVDAGQSLASDRRLATTPDVSKGQPAAADAEAQKFLKPYSKEQLADQAQQEKEQEEADITQPPSWEGEGEGTQAHRALFEPTSTAISAPAEQGLRDLGAPPEVARLGGVAAGAALQPIPGSVGAKVGWGVFAQAVADAANKVKGSQDHPLVTWATELGIPLLAGRILARGEGAIAPHEAAEGVPPRTGPEATVEAQEGKGPTELGPEPETAEAKGPTQMTPGEEPGFVQSVLSKAGNGKAGLSTEPRTFKLGALDQEGHQVVYRAPDGSPVAVATVTRDSAGRPVVMDFATDKSRGVLGAKAAVSVGKELKAMGATPAGSLSPDAQRFLAKADKPVEVPKADAEKITAAEMDERAPVYNIPAKNMKVRPDVFQFKQNVDAKGVTDEYKDAKWNPGLAGVSTVYHVPEGDNQGTRSGLEPGDYALNGHHRTEMAMRNGADTPIPSQYIDAGNDPKIEPIQDRDGRPMRSMPPEQARAFGALQNMADQRGTAFDMAKFMRDTEMEPADVAKLGISMSQAKTADAAGLSKLSPLLWKKIQTGDLPQSRGVVIGRELPDDPAAQDEVYKQTSGKKYTNDQVADMIRLRKTSDVVADEGDQGNQPNLFGKDFLKKSTLPQQAQILGDLRGDLDKETDLTGQTARAKERLEKGGGGTQIDQEALAARATVARNMATALRKFAYLPGTATNSLLKSFGYALSEDPSKRAEITEQARAALPGALKEDAKATGLYVGGLSFDPVAPDYDETTQASLIPRRPEPGVELSGGIVPTAAIRHAQSLAKWVANKLETSKPITILRDVVSPETDGAFGGARAEGLKEEQAAELRSRVGSLHVQAEPLRKWFDQVDPKMRWNVWSELEKGNFDALPKEMQPVAKAIREGFEKSYENVKKARGGEQAYLDNYMGQHMFANNPEEIRDVFNHLKAASGRALVGPTGFTKMRGAGLTMADAIKSGLTPKYDNPVDMMERSFENQWRFITGQQLFQGFKDSGLSRFLKEGERIPAHYAEIDDRIAQVNQFSPGEKGFVKRGRWVAQEGGARILNNYTAPGFNAGRIRSISAIGNSLRQELSTFHIMLESNTIADMEAGGALQEGLGKLAHGDLKGGAAKLLSVPKHWATVPDMYSAWRKGWNMRKDAAAGRFEDPALRDYMTAGGSFDFGDSVLEQALGSALGEKLGIAGRFLSHASGATMKYIVTPAKAGAFSIMKDRELKRAVERNGGEDLNYVQRRAVMQQVRRHLDNTMGQIARDNLGMHNKLKDAIGTIIGYPGWNIGTIRLFGGLGRGAYQFATGQALDDQARLALQFAAGKAIRAGVTGSIINYLVTGQMPQNMYEAYTWPTGEKDSNGNEIRMTPPEYLTRDLLGFIGHRRQHEAALDLSPTTDALIDLAGSKLSWPLVAGYEIYRNADFFGHPIQFKDDATPKRAMDIIKHIVGTPEPFPISNIGEQRQQAGEAPGLGGFGKDVVQHPLRTAKETAIGVSGLTPSPRALRQTAMQNFVEQTENAQFQSQPTDPKQQAHTQALRDLRKQWRDYRAKKGPVPDAKAYAKQGISQQEMVKEWKASAKTPLEAALGRIPLPAVAQAYNVAKDHDNEKDAELAKRTFIKRAQATWGKMTPQQKQQIAPLMREMIAPKKEAEARPEA